LFFPGHYKTLDKYHQLFIFTFSKSFTEGGNVWLRFRQKQWMVKRSWFVVDANGKTLGRLASRVASVLKGKTKPIYTTHVDTGDFVIIVNADKIHLTGKKLEQKTYYSPFGLSRRPQVRHRGQAHEDQAGAGDQDGGGGMLPKTRLGKQMLPSSRSTRGKTPHRSTAAGGDKF